MNSASIDALWKIKDTFPNDAFPGGASSSVICCSNKKCSSQTFTYEDNVCVCVVCNTVQDKLLDTGAEWRFFGAETNSGSKDPSRCGMPINDLLPQGSISTFIGQSFQRYNYDMMKISRYQLWNAVPYKERSYFSATEHVANVAMNNGIPDSIVSEAKILLRKVSDQFISRGENRKGLLACSIYTACIMNNVPRSVKEIADHFGVSTACITKMSKKFQQALSTVKLPMSRASDFVNRYCSELKMDPSLCLQIVQIIEENTLLSDVSPMSCVAGCIYIASELSNLGIVRENIATVCGVSEVTISKVNKKLSGYMQFIQKKIQAQK